MTPLESYKREINRLENEIAAANVALLTLQKSCGHPEHAQVEVDYQQGIEVGYSDPPFAVCSICGYSETGWGAGYWRLQARDKRRVNRDVGRAMAKPHLNSQRDQHRERYGREPEDDE